MEITSRIIPTKKDILIAAIDQHESVMKDFSDRIREMEKGEENENPIEHDKYFVAHRVETLAEMNLLREQLEFASHERDELLRIESYYDKVHDCIEFGSVVITDKKTFFVSTSIAEFVVGDYPLFGLSVYTPLYKAMKGKRKGETFSYGGQTYAVKSVF